MPRINRQVLGSELAKQGFESVAVGKHLPDGRIEAQANKLHPLPTSGAEPLYAPIPVSLVVDLDGRGHVRSIEGGVPDDDAVVAAVRHVKTLSETGQLAEIEDTTGSGRAMPAGATHTIELDTEGRRVLRRKRFSLA